jgi:hypothetical protein
LATKRKLIRTKIEFHLFILNGKKIESGFIFREQKTKTMQHQKQNHNEEEGKKRPKIPVKKV